MSGNEDSVSQVSLFEQKVNNEGSDDDSNLFSPCNIDLNLNGPYADNAKEIPPVPEYFDKFSSFFTRMSDCCELQQCIHQKLELLGCDIGRRTIWKTEGVFYSKDRDCMINYCVNIFRCDSDENNDDDCCWLVEIQRWNGDVLLFSHFFKDLMKLLSRDVVHELSVGVNMDFMDEPLSAKN